MMPPELTEAREAEARAQKNLQRAVKALNVASRRRQEVEFYLRKARREAEAAAALAEESKR